ncbi:kinase-like protein [Zopfia rhizophila CBS 207.26]|uniref:Kinase-like protein n=1 Tax=Zopfia rhizophila CBS 207.26 TaxID=1314779 RepID=A0A6A6EKK9_9PEZI|nr:kinase-like protein [Zopfia rhizophila CBS 207.26]
MAAEAPCTAYSWTSKRQGSCRYDSHVKLFYGVSNRGVWSLGSNFILKERSNQPPNFEARNIRFLKENTTIPVPTVVEEWNEENKRYFMLTKRIRGDALNTSIARQTADHLFQLRQLHSPHMQSLSEQPLYSAFLFPNGYGLPHGPLSSDDELWTEMETALKSVPEKARWRLRERMPSAGPYTFTHGDLTNVNIIVEDGNLTGILDWEASGYFPVWWEFTCAGIGLGQEDQEWKALLRKHMPSYAEAREFWLDFYALCKYPNLNERGEALLSELQHE